MSSIVIVCVSLTVSVLNYSTCTCSLEDNYELHVTIQCVIPPLFAWSGKGIMNCEYHFCSSCRNSTAVEVT